MEKTIWLTIVTPAGEAARVQCDALRFQIPDGAKNRNTGGSIGIRPGHTDALMAVAAGEVTAALHGETVLRYSVEAGLAMVSGGNVTILTDRIEKKS